MQHFFTLIFSLFFISGLHGQRPTYHIVHTETKPSLDGTAEPEIWNNALIINGFITTLPRFNESPAHPTSVKMVAHPKGIALFFECTSPTVRADGSQRDNMGYADYVAVGFDTWNDDQNAFVFQVSASGQTSERQESSNNTDVLYHSRWEAAVSVRADGWTAELWIPYTALRFPAGGEQQWGVQLWRYDRSTGETSTWSPQNPVIRDEVWQYGDLEGLGPIRQEARRSATIYNKNEYESTEDQFSLFTSKKDDGYSHLGLDARIGFNSATTLDVTCLPDKPIITEDLFEEYSLLFNATDKAFIHPGQHEFRDIYSKSGTLSDMPVFYSDQIPGVKLPQGGAIIGSYIQSDVLNRLYFSTRTKNNFAWGINHVLWARPDASIGTGSFIREQREIPRNPGNLEFTAEKALRNNSWVHTSQAVTYFRGTHPSVRSSYAVQLRDKSNQYEIAGRYRGQFQQTTSNGLYSAGDGYLSLGKVNGRWTWGSTMEVMPRTNSGILYQEGLLNQQPVQYQSISHISKNNYQPNSKRFLSIQHRLSSTYSWSKNEANYQRVTYTFAATDKRFNGWEVSVFSSPLKQMRYFFLNSLPVHLREAHPLGSSFNWRSDQRRRYQFSVNLYGDGNTHTQAQQDIGSNISTVWAINDHFRAEGNYHFSISYNLRSAITVPGSTDDLIAVISHKRQYGAIQFYYFPAPQWHLYLSGTASSGVTTKQEFFKVLSDGSTVSATVPPSFSLLQGSSLGLKTGLRWNINNNSQLGVSVFYARNFSENTGTQSYIYEHEGLNVNTTLILQLGKKA